MKQCSHWKGSRNQWRWAPASTLSKTTERNMYQKGKLSSNSQKPSLLLRMNLLNQHPRLLNHMSECSMTGIKSRPLVKAVKGEDLLLATPMRHIECEAGNLTKIWRMEMMMNPSTSDSSKFAWSESQQFRGIGLHSDCAKTQEYVTNYMLDIKTAKANLLNLGFTPEFPDSEWRNVLLCLPINLNAVHSGQYSMEHKSKVSEELSDFTISMCEVNISKSIKSTDNWVIAWGQTSAATTFAFPHWQQECLLYNKQILDLFASFTKDHHSLILNYDRAVRKHVGACRELLLTDFQDFTNLCMQYLNVHRANAEPQMSQGGNTSWRSARHSGDACLHWNWGTCSSSPEQCFIFAPTAANLATTSLLAQTNQNQPQNKQVLVIKCPDYLRSFFWDTPQDFTSHSAYISETLPPLPQVPQDEWDNEVVTDTIWDYAYLFHITTPINIPRLQSLLVNHPNQLFVSSILNSLRNGTIINIVTLSLTFYNSSMINTTKKFASRDSPPLLAAICFQACMPCQFIPFQNPTQANSVSSPILVLVSSCLTPWLTKLMSPIFPWWHIRTWCSPYWLSTPAWQHQTCHVDWMFLKLITGCQYTSDGRWSRSTPLMGNIMLTGATTLGGKADMVYGVLSCVW